MRNISIPVNGSQLHGWKHDFLEKSVGGCTVHDVIALWPDLTHSNFAPKVAQGMPHNLGDISARSAQQFGGNFRRTPRGCINPPSGEGIFSIFSISNFLKIIFHKYMKNATSSGVVHVSEWNVTYWVASYPVSWLPNALFGDFFKKNFFGGALSRIKKKSKMNIQTVNNS